LFLLDPAVPGFADFDLVQELRRYDAHVPLVIYGTDGDDAHTNEPAQAVLTKPLSARAVRETATRLLKRDAAASTLHVSHSAFAPAAR
jgi:DNA-binding response OmpR family regulator